MYILIPAGQIPTPISYMPAPEAFNLFHTSPRSALHGDFTDQRSSEYWAAQTFCLQQGPQNWHLQGKRSCGVSQSVCLCFFREMSILRTTKNVPNGISSLSILKYDIPVSSIWRTIAIWSVILSHHQKPLGCPIFLPYGWSSSHLVQQSAVVLGAQGTQMDMY